MILNKKGFMMLPLAALLFTSCNSWKGIDYEAAKNFIDTNYKLDGATAKLPAKVHEEFNATANDVLSCSYEVIMAMSYFYSTNVVLNKLEFTEEAPFKCHYKDDYVPSPEEFTDPKLLPIASDSTAEVSDVLMQSDEKLGLTVTYQTNGKKFKQNMSGKMYDGLVNATQSFTYNDEGYRSEVSGECSGSGEVENPATGKKETINFSFTFNATYTY
ncbi:MAG: hypothetical protein MJ213_04775 [Bacilli bacterium]|nr:hypothetical protein [Bacilli bacterium]